MMLAVGRRSTKTFTEGARCTGRRHSRGFFTSLFGGGDASPDGNPIEEALMIHKDGEDEAKQSIRLPKYGHFKPQHLTDAVEKLRSKRKAALEDFESSLNAVASEAAASNEALRKTMTQWHDEVYAPMTELQNISVACFMLAEPQTLGQWRKAHAQVFEQTPIEEALQGVDAHKLQSTLHQETTDPEIRSASGFLLQHLAPLTIQEPEKAKAYQQCVDQSNQVDEFLLQLDAQELASDKTALSHVFTAARKSVELKDNAAQILGYSSHVDQILSKRMATEEELQILHVEAAENFLPVVGSLLHDPFDKRILSQMASPTLDGCMGALQKLVSSLFGVEMTDDNKTSIRDHAWNPDSRVLRIHDDKSGAHLGTILLDPYQRPGKLQRNFTIPLRHRRENVLPVVGVCLQMEQPVWDDAPVNMTWDQAESMFHEFAHALQIVLGQSTLGGILGAQNLPLDVSEIMPKFFEHCLFEKSCLDTIMDQSGGAAALANDMPALLQWRNHRKTLQIMQSVYFGALELELFNFDAEGDESLVGMYRRVSTQFVPHDMPPQNDVAPLLQIMKDNANGTVLGGYRYFWGEVVAAGLFQSFEQAGSEKGLLSGQEGVENLGRRLRTEFLDPGAAFDTAAPIGGFEGLRTMNHVVDAYK